MDLKEIKQQVEAGLSDLAASTAFKPGALFVVGCSTSEIGGHLIGTHSSEDIAAAVMDAVWPFIKAHGLYLAVQCCEHLNRVLVVERAAADQYDLNEVWVKPWLHAGGAFAVCAMATMEAPIIVEDIKGKASAGIDIGGTFIGMHLRPVVVPIHSAHRHVGKAVLTMARTRPKYVGGPRAQYAEMADRH